LTLVADPPPPWQGVHPNFANSCLASQSFIGCVAEMAGDTPIGDTNLGYPDLPYTGAEIAGFFDFT
jgi:hypothetical protein